MIEFVLHSTSCLGKRHRKIGTYAVLQEARTKANALSKQELIWSANDWTYIRKGHGENIYLSYLSSWLDKENWKEKRYLITVI